MISNKFIQSFALLLLLSCNNDQNLNSPESIDEKLGRTEYFGCDSIGSSCFIQIDPDGLGLIKIVDLGIIDQYFGKFEFDSLSNTYEFLPFDFFNVQLCKSKNWNSNSLSIVNNTDVVHLYAHLNLSGRDTSIALDSNVTIIDLPNNDAESNHEIEVKIENNKYLGYHLVEFLVPYIHTGLCISNDKQFDKIILKITEDEIMTQKIENKVFSEKTPVNVFFRQGEEQQHLTPHKK